MNINEYMEEYRQAEGALLIDLRNPEDYRINHIPGAINIQVDQVRDEIRRMATFRTPIYLYCYAGVRSAQAETLLKAKGYTVYNMGSFEEYTGEKEGEGHHMDLKQLRTEKGLTQAEMAEAIGVKPVTISAIETARMKISKKISERLVNLYGVEVEDTKEENKSERAPKAGAKRGKKADGTAKKPGRKKKKDTAPKKRGRKPKAAVAVTYQTPDGREIAEADILDKVGPADRIYVRLDEGKAYWVKGEESGEIELW